MKRPIGAGFRISPFRLRSARSGGCGLSAADRLNVSPGMESPEQILYFRRAEAFCATLGTGLFYEG